MIKQEHNGPKPWFKVSKVCPDSKGMFLIHFRGIWGNLGEIQQRYSLSKTRFEENNSLLICTDPRRCPGGVENCHEKPNLIVKFCCVNEQKVVFFSQKIRFHFFQKNAKITRFVLLKMKNYTSTYILIFVLEPIFFNK